jgi:hypothetical protein
LSGVNKPGGTWLLKGDPASVANEVEIPVVKSKSETKKEKKGLNKEKRGKK